MNSGSSGSFNRPIYDNCATQKYYYESTSPLKYRLYHGAHENCNKCTYKKQFWTPYELVDIESELRNQTRPLSDCPQFQYNPKCKDSSMCLSTYSPNVPVVFAPEICPIVHSNILSWNSPGYHLSNPKNMCNGKDIMSRFDVLPKHKVRVTM